MTIEDVWAETLVVRERGHWGKDNLERSQLAQRYEGPEEARISVY